MLYTDPSDHLVTTRCYGVSFVEESIGGGRQAPDCQYSRNLSGSRTRSLVSCYIMFSVSVCENCRSIEGWIHSKRRNKLHQTLVEKLVHTHTSLVARESLDDTLHHLLPWDRSYHRLSRWWTRRGTRSLSVNYFYSYLLRLLRVETRVWT